MAKDEIDRAARAGADDVAGASKQQEAAALLKKLKVEAAEKAAADTDHQVADEAKADEAIAVAESGDVSVEAVADSYAASEEGGLSTATLLTIGGVALVAGGIAIAASDDDDGDKAVPPPPPPQELDLTAGADEIDLTDSASADVIRGIVDPLEFGMNDESTFSNGDIIQGNGQTIVRLFVDSGATTQPADVVRMSDVATVELFAQTTSTVVFPAVSWDGVGEIAYVGGIGGMGVFATSLDAGVDMRIAENVAGGFIGASYTTNLVAIVGNSGKGGASISFGADDLADLAVNVAQPLNTGFMFVGGVLPGDVNVGDMTGVAGNSASLFVGASVSGDLNAGNISLTLGDAGFASVTLDTTGDLTVGNIDIAMGDAGSALVAFTDNSGDINVGDLSIDMGDSASVSVYYSATSGDLNAGDVSIAAGNNASVTVSLTAGNAVSAGSVNAGNVTIAVGDYTNSAAFGGHIDPLYLGIYAADDVTAGNIDLSAGDGLATGTLHFGVSVTAGTAGTDGGNISLGNVSVVGGDNADVYASIDFSNSGTDITVGDVNLQVGDRLSTLTGNTAPSAYLGVFNNSALAGADITVGDISMVAGLSGAANAYVSLTGIGGATQTGDLGSLTVGNVSVDLGQNGTGSVYIEQQQNATGDLGMGDLTVGDFDVTLGQDATLSITVTQNLSGSGVATMGDLTVGGLVADIGIGGDLYYNVYGYNSGGTGAGTADMGNVSVGDVSIVADDGAYVSISYSFSATSGAIPSVSIGDIDVTMGVGATFTLAGLSIEGGSLGDVSIGDLSFNMGQSSSGDFGNSINISATTGDIGSVSVGNMSLTLDNAAFWSDFAVYIFAAGDIGTASIGDLNVNLAASASWSSYAYYTVSASGDIGDVSFGSINVEMDAAASISETIERNAYADEIGSVSFGDVSINAHGITSTVSVTLSASASVGDIGSVSIGDISLVADSSTTAPLNVYANLAAAAEIGEITVGNVLLSYTTASTAGVTFSLTQNAVTDGDVTVGGLTLDFTAVGTAGAAATDYYTFNVNAGGGDVHIGLIDVNVTLSSTNVASATAEAGLLNLTNILSGVVTTGDISLGTVDYSDYVYAGTLVNPTLTIDVSGYLGDITIIGSDGIDNIIGNTGVNTMTGNDGADIFNVGNGQGALTAADADKIVDFVHNEDLLVLDVTTAATVNEYSEGTYATFAAFLTDATARANDADPDYLIAGQVGTSVFIASDANQDGTIDFVVELQNASISTLDFGDYSQI